MRTPTSLDTVAGVGRLELIWQDSERVFFRAWSELPGGDLAPVLALQPVAGSGWPEGPDRLAHEFALKDVLDAVWAVLPLALVHERNMLFLADRGNSESFEVRLTGFGLASRVPRERKSPVPPEVIAGTFAYMAPEQTGRMNRSIDARSDLYSLGVTRYAMLTGVLPFSAADPMEWIHCHIARQAGASCRTGERAPRARLRRWIAGCAAIGRGLGRTYLRPFVPSSTNRIQLNINPYCKPMMAH